MQYFPPDVKKTLLSSSAANIYCFKLNYAKIIVKLQISLKNIIKNNRL